MIVGYDNELVQVAQLHKKIYILFFNFKPLKYNNKPFLVLFLFSFSFWVGEPSTALAKKPKKNRKPKQGRYNYAEIQICCDQRDLDILL